MSGLYNKMLGNSLKTYTFNKTDVSIINQKPLSSLSETLVIPLFDAKVIDPVALEVEEKDKPTVESALNKLLEGVTLSELNEKRISLATCSGVATGLKNVIFILLENSQQLTKEKLEKHVRDVLLKAEEQKLGAVSFCRLVKSGNIGISNVDVGQSCAKVIREHCNKVHGDDNPPLSHIFFVCSDSAYNNELLRAFDTASTAAV